MKIHPESPALKRLMYLAIIGFIVLAAWGCRKKEGIGSYHRFADKTWPRFNILRFELPVTTPGTYDIKLLAGLTAEFEYEDLNFNMVMDTPSGEERIREFRMKVKKPDGTPAITCNNDSCQGVILLKRGIRVEKPGKMIIDIENLTPRMSTAGVLGIGINMEPSGE